jgi:(2R)-3-sulfolactate dehydrogenase (NADP+)
VEILAAALTSAHFGFEASSFFEAEGDSPNIGQLLIAIAPGPLSAGSYASRIEVLLQAILGQEGTRLPGSGKSSRRNAVKNLGLNIDRAVFHVLTGLRPG